MQRLKTHVAFPLVLPLGLLVGLLLSACTSAGEHLEEGISAEGSGQYYRAANQYIDALEKDSQMVEARDRLIEVGESAITQSLNESDARLRARDAVGAGSEFLRMDGLLKAALRVGVRIPVPGGYQDARRSAFDAAISELMALGSDSQRRGQWEAGEGAFTQIREDFEPSASQERESLDAESRLLLDWALSEEGVDRFRRAFELAGEAIGVPGGAPGEVVREAEALRDRTLAAGTSAVVVLPVTKVPEVEGRGEADPAQLLSDALELDHWRHPPPFVAVADPLMVRTVTRRLTPRGGAPRVERILDELRGDFAVLIELTYLTTSQRNPRRRTRSTRTREGATVSYTEEESTLRYEVRAQLLILDRDGREVGDFPVSENESGSFEWGIYDGDVADLQLSRAESRLFDPIIQGQQRSVIEDALMAHLAEKIAEEVYRRVLDRIR